MSSELQIQSSILGSIVARAIEAKLLSASFDPTPIEHVAIASAPVATAPTNAAVRLQVPLEISFVHVRKVLTKVNDSTTEAIHPQTRAMAILELAATGAIVTLRCIDVDLGLIDASLDANAAATKDALISLIGSPFTSDLSGVFKKLGVPIPRFSRVDLVAGVVTVRFEPAGAATARLPAGQEWGLFLDGSAVEKLAKSKLPTDFTSHITSLVIDAHWRPSHNVPHVDLDYSCKAPQVGEPIAGDVSGTIGCDFSLMTTDAKLLRSTVSWTLAIKLGALVPKFVTDLVKDAITGYMNPARFGGVAIDDHSFVLESPLPEILFGGARLEHTTLIATSTGMTFGGSVELPVEDNEKTNCAHSIRNELASACTCESANKIGNCAHCRTRTGNKSGSEPAKFHNALSAEKTTWEREILSKVLGSLRRAENWANAALPCRDFIAVPSGHALPVPALKSNSRNTMAPRAPNPSAIPS